VILIGFEVVAPAVALIAPGLALALAAPALGALAAVGVAVTAATDLLAVGPPNKG
jgi:hypothetical protein